MIKICHGDCVTSFGWLSCTCLVFNICKKTQSEQKLIGENFVPPMSWKRIIWTNLWNMGQQKHNCRLPLAILLWVTTFTVGHGKQLTMFYRTTYCRKKKYPSTITLMNSETWKLVSFTNLLGTASKRRRTENVSKIQGTKVLFIPLSCWPPVQFRLSGTEHPWLLQPASSGTSWGLCEEDRKGNRMFPSALRSAVNTFLERDDKGCCAACSILMDQQIGHNTQQPCNGCSAKPPGCSTGDRLMCLASQTVTWTAECPLLTTLLLTLRECGLLV